MSPLGLCWHNKMLLPAICLKSSVSQLANFPQHFLGDRPELQRWWVTTSLVTGASPTPWTARRRSHQEPKDRLDAEGDSSSWQVGVRALEAQRNPVRYRNQWGEGNTAHQTGRNLVSNSGLPQEAMGHPSNCLFWGWNCVSQVQGPIWKYCAVWECMKMWVEMQPSCEVRSFLSLCVCLAVW
jgi:hypothetical protein